MDGQHPRPTASSRSPSRQAEGERKWAEAAQLTGHREGRRTAWLERGESSSYSVTEGRKEPFATSQAQETAACRRMSHELLSRHGRTSRRREPSPRIQRAGLCVRGNPAPTGASRSSVRSRPPAGHEPLNALARWPRLAIYATGVFRHALPVQLHRGENFSRRCDSLADKIDRGAESNKTRCGTQLRSLHTVDEGCRHRATDLEPACFVMRPTGSAICRSGPRTGPGMTSTRDGKGFDRRGYERPGGKQSAEKPKAPSADSISMLAK